VALGMVAGVGEFGRCHGGIVGDVRGEGNSLGDA
jgi:hypothetical protein